MTLFEVSSRRFAIAMAGASALALAAACPALAQVTTEPVTPAQAAADPAPPEAADELEEVVVTGSRITRRDYVSNTPITTVNAATLASTGAATVEGSLAQLPQFTVGEGATTTGFFSSGQAALNLRGLGPFRNLVLMDGRRLQPSNTQQVVDINTIPRALIDSVEVISGGASAVYGSDAIAGVVNFKIRNHFAGLQVDAQYTTPELGQGSSTDLSVTIGGDFAGGRGNAVLSLGYTERGSIPYDDIDFFDANRGQGDLRLYQGAYNPTTNRPSQAALNAVFGAYGVAPGAVTPSSFISFNDDGTLFSATQGVDNFKGSIGLVVQGAQVNYRNLDSIHQTPLERESLFARTTYELGGGIEAFAQAHYASYLSTTIAEAGNAAISVPVTNPFIPADLRTLLLSRPNPNAPLQLERRFREAGPRIFNREFDVLQLLGGLRGRWERIDGGWEVYGSRGRTNLTETQPGSVIRSSLEALLTAPDGGRSLCEGGYDAFGLTTLSAACTSYLVGTPIRETELTQDVLEANLQGRLFQLPAGEARFALGAAHRRNGYDFLPDRLSATGGVIGAPYTTASSGETDVSEVYGEVSAPLLAGLPLIERLEVDLAYRYSDYNLAGGVSTYKADFAWTVVPQLRLRGGYQRAVRAPSVGELFVAPTGSFSSIGEPSSGGGDPCSVNSQARQGAANAQISALCVAQGVPAGLIGSFVNLQNDAEATNVGNLALQPETADTYTLGLVLRSPFASPLLSQLQLSVDYYAIEITDVIGVISALQSLSKCFNLDGSNPGYAADNFFCTQVERNRATGSIVQLRQPTLNLGAYKTSGLDVQLDWRAPLDAFGLSPGWGALSLNSVVSYLESFQIQTTPGGRFFEYGGTVSATTNGQPGSLPKWKAVTTARWQGGEGGVGLRWRFIDSMGAIGRVTNPAATTPDTPSQSVFDLFGDWRLTERVAVRGGINNLFDEDPPVVNGVPGNTQPSTYDILGRVYFVGLTANF